MNNERDMRINDQSGLFRLGGGGGGGGRGGVPVLISRLDQLILK